MVKLVDLTHTVTDNMPVYPGDNCMKFYSTMAFEEHGVRDEKIESGMHVGTHMDAPIHMLETGAYIADIPLGHFQGRGVIVDARKADSIHIGLLDNVELQEGDIVLVWTGWSEKFKDSDYYEGHAVFEESFAHALVDAKVKVAAMDIPSPDAPPFPIHKILLKNDVMIIENATNLSALEGIKDFIIHAYPAKYKASGAPVRLVAEIRGE